MKSKLKENKNINDLVERAENYREGLKNDYTTNTVDEETKELITKRTEISKKLKEQLTEEQQKLWEEYWDIDNQIQEELHRNLFLYGYITATELFVETTDKRYKVRNDKT